MKAAACLSMRFSDFLDSSAAFGVDCTDGPIGEHLVVAGRLFEPDDPERSLHRGRVVWWADELWALLRREVDAAAVAAVHRTKLLMGAEVELEEDDRKVIFGGAPGLTRFQIDALWRTWSKPRRRSYISRQVWAVRRMVDRGVQPTEDHKLRAANYAVGRMVVRGYIEDLGAEVRAAVAVAPRT